jgi:ferredoxin-NADP reductase
MLCGECYTKLPQFETEVTQVLSRTKDAKSIRFRKSEGFDYLPGQWIFVTLGRGDKQKTKPLSLSSSPTEGFLEVTKRLTGHEFSNALNALGVGDTASIRDLMAFSLFMESSIKSACWLAE